MRKERKKLLLARETIRDLSSLDAVKGGTRGTLACTLISLLPACTEYCATTPITSLGYTCPV
jgi:hypothetical protein